MNMKLLGLSFAALLAGVAACGGGVVGDTSGGSGAGATTGAGASTSAGTTGVGGSALTGTSSGAGGGSSGGSPCPATPTEGASCAGAPAGFRCTYGDSTRPDCRDAWTCMNGVWTEMASACAMTTGCPTTQPQAQSTCSMSGDVNETCTYDAVICLCDACAAGPCMVPPVEWQCAGPPTSAGCPPVAPNDGTACTAEGADCTYGFPCTGTGAEVTCTGGLWRWNMMIACAD